MASPADMFNNAIEYILNKFGVGPKSQEVKATTGTNVANMQPQMAPTVQTGSTPAAPGMVQ